MLSIEELLEKLPEKIEHPKIITDWSDGKFTKNWSDELYEFNLVMKKLEENKFYASYIFTGFEGEEFYLPMSSDDIRNYFDYGYCQPEKTFAKPTLQEALQDLYDWYLMENKIKDLLDNKLVRL